MDALYLIVGIILGAGIFAAGCFIGWRVGHLARGDSAPHIIEAAWDGGEHVSLEPAFWPDKESEG